VKKQDETRDSSDKLSSAVNARKIDKKKLVDWAGRILMIVSVILIIWKVIQYDIDFSVLVLPSVIVVLALSALVYGASIFFTSFNFRWLIEILSGISVPKTLAVSVYCSSNLYKYIPGNIMHFVGRNRLAVEVEELKHDEVAFATIMDNLFLCLAAVVISVICVLNYFVEYLRQIHIPDYMFIAAGAAIFILIVLAVIFRRRLAKWLKKYTEIIKRFSPLSALKLMLVSALRLLALAVTFFAVLAVLGQAITLDIIPQIIGLFVLSWVAGFLIPGAPGGLGVREMIMITFMGDTLDQSILLTSTIIHRVVCILGDIAAWGISLLYSRLKGRKETDAQN